MKIDTLHDLYIHGIRDMDRQQGIEATDGLTQLLEAMRGTTLLVHGARDNAVPVAAAREAAKVLPSAQLEELPALGHLAHEEDPANAARLISTFADCHIAA